MKHTIKNNTVESVGNGIALGKNPHPYAIRLFYDDSGIQGIYVMPVEKTNEYDADREKLYRLDESLSTDEYMPHQEEFEKKWSKYSNHEIEELIVYPPLRKNYEH